MDLVLKPLNKKKFLESQLIQKYRKLDTQIKIENIYWNKNSNLNKKILKSCNKNPNLLIIYFSNNTSFNIQYTPVYPIFYEDIFYITPLNLYQVNGFTNLSNDKNFLIEDFISRIMITFGGILCDKSYNLSYMLTTNIENGIKNWIKNNSILKYNYVNKVEKYMTINIPKSNAGWFSLYNKLLTDYVFKNYSENILNVAELGVYFGKSTKYISEKLFDNNYNNNYNNKNIYAFDDFKNILLTEYIIDNITQIDIKYFFKYIKYDTFHSNLSNYSNIYSITYNCYQAHEWLKNNNINIDLFYIDFCKKDDNLIKLVDKIFILYPKCIIIGDDAKWLNNSLEYFSQKYEYIYAYDCYCLRIKKYIFKNKKKLLDSIKNLYNLMNLKNINNIPDNFTAVQNSNAEHVNQ
jgi:hypothetical protein